MISTTSRLIGLLLILITLVGAPGMLAAAAAGDSGVKPIKPKGATASSTNTKYAASRAIDGVISDDSRWVSQESESGAWLEIDLGGVHTLAGVHLFTGWKDGSAAQNIAVLFFANGKWNEIPSAVVKNNQAVALPIAFDEAVKVTTDRLRIVITDPKPGVARVKEVLIFPAGAGNLPAIAGVPAPVKTPLIYLNQSGFNIGKPKRFTAPTLADQTAFIVRPASGGKVLFEGVIENNIGDFTVFDPAGEGQKTEYIVEAGGHASVPFRIAPFWLERVSYQGAMDFMVDSRHHVGNDRNVCRGSYGWRDDHHFGWELHTLVPQYLSNPSAYERMGRQIKYEAPKDPKLWGKLKEPAAEAPDIVKLIHWGADVIVTQELTHEMLKSQLAYFLYAWPYMKQWLPEQNYAAVRDYAFGVWAQAKADHAYPYDESPEHNLLVVKKKIGTTKGAYPPGFSVQPNLMMYEVARREGRADAEVYLKAATEQVAWMVSDVDWNDPLITKGQRMSEFITMTGLAHFLQAHPDRVPRLAEKIGEWAKVAVRRSENLWDFRKLDDKDQWTPMGDKPQMWNEPGNVVGLPAALLAARPFVTDQAIRARLEQIVWSHWDNCFGRNPTGRHFSYDAPREVEGVELGWYSFHHGGIGRLAEARFVLDGAPKNAHYPYHPERGNIGWTEGWVQFNVAYNISLAYLAHAETNVTLARRGDELIVRLEAPLNFDYDKAETATVIVTSGEGVERITVTEESASSRFLSAKVKLHTAKAAASGDGGIQAAPGASIEAAYGFGYLARRATLKP